MSEIMGQPGSGQEGSSEGLGAAAADFSRSIQEAAEKLLSTTKGLEARAQQAEQAQQAAESHMQQELAELSGLAQELQARIAALATGAMPRPSGEPSSEESQAEAPTKPTDSSAP
jgi:hypothetical protein